MIDAVLIGSKKLRKKTQAILKAELLDDLADEAVEEAEPITSTPDVS